MSMMEERASVWRGLIAEQKTSGLTQAAFCRDRGVSFNSFCNWRTRLPKTGEISGTWVSMPPDRPTTSPHPIRVNVGCAVIEVSAGFDPKLLRDVVAALDPRC